MTSGGKIAVEMTVGGKPKSGASHQPWKSLCDSHIPTARLLLYIFLKSFSRKEPSSPPAPSRFRLILRLEKTSHTLCNASSFLRWCDTLDRWPFLLPFHRIGGTHVCEQVDVLLGGEAVNLYQEFRTNCSPSSSVVTFSKVLLKPSASSV